MRPARKSCSEEFRRRAVDLYESTPGATVRDIAEHLGIVRGTLRGWLEVDGTGKKTAADEALTSSPLRAETTKLATEREALRRAAKYFAGQARW